MTADRPGANFEIWNKTLVNALEGSPSGKAIAGLLGTIIDFDIFMMFHYQEGQATVVSHNVDAARRKIVIDDYLQGPFLLDPFYVHSVAPPLDVFLDMRKLSPDKFQKSEFFRHHYHRTGIADEIGIAIPEANGAACVVSITRRLDETPFSQGEKDLLRAAEPVISLLGRRLLDNPAQPSADLEAKRIEDAFKAFGRDLLSPREIEIVSLILKGHSSLSIGELLGISTGTVKIHRRNIYAKLKISSQAELFNRFIQYFSGS